jgi:hypothetical protein
MPHPTGLASALTRAAIFSAALGALSLAACSSDSTGPQTCAGEKCDEFDRAQLDDRNDPIATYLKTLDISDEGTMFGTYQDMLFGVAGVMGCSTDSIAVFTVSDSLIADVPFPRLVSVACKDDDAKASNFFIAASFEDQDTGDVDVLDVEMFAWDATRREYLFYAFTHAEDGADGEDGEVKLEISPKRCEECHLTPADSSPVGMRMTPIMNELNRPWTHWNAEPGFPSFNFVVPDGMDEKPNYKALAIGNKAPAQRLEEIIKFGGHSKVASARIRDRRNAPNIDEIMGMFRPVFCAEQLNYISEDHDSGVVFNSAVIDSGIRSMYIQIRPDNWVYSWVNDQTLRIPVPGSEEVVVQIPVRGNADVAMETSLVSTRVLTPQQVLRARVLDWQNPVFSEFRCDLWRDARTRFAATPPDFGTATRNSNVMSDIFEQIMTVEGKPIGGADPGTLIMMANADSTTATKIYDATRNGVLEDGDCATDGYCAGTVDDFGAILEAHMDALTSSATPRDDLRALRKARICRIIEEVTPTAGDDRFPDGVSSRFPNNPSLPDVGACN